MAWQRGHGRHDLPWQSGADAYRVWLSEVMLQQTQVATVLRYFDRFLQRFPDVQALAAAPLESVLAAWSGLGYYRRARLAHACARAVVAEHSGQFPQEVEALAALPGIGRSTAGAIASLAHGQRAAILDGNVKRVLTRVLGFDGDLAQAREERRLWAWAEALLPEHTEKVRAHNQGLMDLGATVCTPQRPACDRCPWHSGCVARAQGRPEAYPVKTRKLKRSRRDDQLLWLFAGARVLLARRPDTGVWAGLWSPPVLDAEALAHWRAGSGIDADWGPGRPAPPFLHVLTHRDWWFTPWRWQRAAMPSAAARARLEASLSEAAAQAGQPLAALQWLRLDEALALALPAPVRKTLVLEAEAGRVPSA